MTIVALYPGTFDPITNGHLDIIERATCLFDKVIVAVAVTTHPIKNPLFTPEERVILIEEVVQNLDRVKVASFEGLTVDYARECSATVLIRGIRTFSDFDFEYTLASINRRLAPEIQTVFLAPDEKYIFLSSSVVREVAKLGGDASSFVPESVNKALTQKFLPLLVKRETTKDCASTSDTLEGLLVR